MDAILSSLAERTASLSEVDMSNRKREKAEERLSCFSRMFSYYSARKERRICTSTLEKRLQRKSKNVSTTMVSIMQSYHLVSYNLRVLYVSSFFILITPSSLIVTLKLPRTVLLLLLPDRVFILLRPRATRVPAFGFAPIAVI